jgi:hypothetical protein
MRVNNSRICSQQVFNGREFFFGELDIFSVRDCGHMASGENPVTGGDADFGQSDNFCVKKIRRLQMNDPNTNCGNLHDETKRLYSALAADCRIELTDTERVGLIRRLLALKVSVPLFALLAAAIVAPHSTHVATRNQDAILMTA